MLKRMRTSRSHSFTTLSILTIFTPWHPPFIPMQTGLRFEYLAPYSPDYNPIEKCFSKIKGHLKKLERIAPIRDLIADAVSHITPKDIDGYFRFSSLK